MTPLFSMATDRTRSRTGLATLWVILSLPVMVVLVLYAVEAGRIHLARQQLVTALESAAMAAAKKCATTASPNTLLARQCANEFAMANLVLDDSVSIDLNRDGTNLPTENASCDGELVMGELVEVDPTTEFDAGRLGSCSQKAGPNAVAFQTKSTESWETVTLCERSYNNMVVIGTINYDASFPPMVVRIRNAVGNSFEFFVQQVNDGSPASDINVHFFVVEAGVYTTATDGIKMEAGKFVSVLTDRNGLWLGQRQAYANMYTRPVVVGQVMTYNDPRWSVFWSHGGARPLPVNPLNFWAGKHVGEDIVVVRNPEIIGYVVLDEGPQDINGLDAYAGVTSNSVRGVGNAPPYTSGFPAGEPGTFAVASQSGMNGGDGSWAVLYGSDPVDPSRISFAVDEDQIRNAERNHLPEYVHYVAFAGPCSARAQAVREVDWYFSSLFGLVLPPATVQGEAFAYFDCVEDCSKLLCVDSFVCP